jgi:hypothetical protein
VAYGYDNRTESTAVAASSAMFAMSDQNMWLFVIALAIAGLINRLEVDDGPDGKGWKIRIRPKRKR